MAGGGRARARGPPAPDRIAPGELALLHRSVVGYGVAPALGIAHHEARSFGAKCPPITDLSSRFGVEGRLVEHHDARLARTETLHRLAVVQEKQHPPSASTFS